MNIDENLVSQKRPIYRIYQHQMRQLERELWVEYILGTFFFIKNHQMTELRGRCKKMWVPEKALFLFSPGVKGNHLRAHGPMGKLNKAMDIVCSS